MAIKIESPEGYSYYNGLIKTKILYTAEELAPEWALISDEKLSNIDTNLDDGLDPIYWENIQQNGERTDYSYAFCNSGYSCLKPQFPIVANNVMYMFMGCTELENAENVLITITSKKPNMMYVCVNCTKMIKAPIFNFSNAPIIKTYTSMYAGCQSLTDLSVYWGDGSTDPITQRNACQNTFFKCYKLKNVDFGAEETGSPLYLDLSYSTEITIDSIRSLFSSLQTVNPEEATAQNSKHEIIFSTTTMNLIRAESAELIDSFGGKGWTLLEEDRQIDDTEE